jgi:hypothetical protein
MLATFALEESRRFGQPVTVKQFSRSVREQDAVSFNAAS